VAIGVNGKLKAIKEDNNLTYSHSERLHIFIFEILQESSIQLSELDAVAISKGPGSYTGLRIGVSSAKGLSFSLDIPLIAVPTLTSLASRISRSGLRVPMLDARRMEVYTAVFNENMEQVEETSAKILTGDSYREFLEMGRVNFTGSGAGKFKEICDHPNAVFLEDQLPSAKEMIAPAEEKYKLSNFENVAYFEPYYLKDFMAG